MHVRRLGLYNLTVQRPKWNGAGDNVRLRWFHVSQAFYALLSRAGFESIMSDHKWEA